jgi:hypothetical protein
MAAPRGETEDYVWESIGVLPIELLSFTGSARGDRVELEWATASERNTSHYVIERSNDNGTSEALGSVAAAGESSTRQDYRFDDPRPSPPTRLVCTSLTICW